MKHTLKDNTQRMYEAVRADYKRLKSVQGKLGGRAVAQKYSEDFIIHQLADKYFKSIKTIENILYRSY